jgi:Bacterial aa3 type cytochrome c oxidase subunit IV
MASGNDMKTAEATYGGFLSFLKWGIGITVFVTIVVVLLIS